MKIIAFAQFYVKEMDMVGFVMKRLLLFKRDDVGIVATELLALVENRYRVECLN